jgi:hypothetical protein
MPPIKPNINKIAGATQQSIPAIPAEPANLSAHLIKFGSSWGTLVSLLVILFFEKLVVRL